MYSLKILTDESVCLFGRFFFYLSITGFMIFVELRLFSSSINLTHKVPATSCGSAWLGLQHFDLSISDDVQPTVQCCCCKDFCRLSILRSSFQQQYVNDSRGYLIKGIKNALGQSFSGSKVISLICLLNLTN